MASIYLITNTVNSKTYVGKTKNSIQKRFASHLNSARKGAETILYRAIRKYGNEAFVIELIEETSLELLSTREIHYISTLKPEYNMTKGGEGRQPLRPMKLVHNGLIQKHILLDDPIPKGFVRGLLDSTKAKLSESHNGKIVSQETREKISVANTGELNGFFGRKHSNETKAKLKDVHTRPWVGRSHSDETKTKMSLSNKGRITSEETRKLLAIAKSPLHQITSPSGVVYMVRPLREFCKAHTLSYGTLFKTLKTGIVSKTGYNTGWSIRYVT